VVRCIGTANFLSQQSILQEMAERGREHCPGMDVYIAQGCYHPRSESFTFFLALMIFRHCLTGPFLRLDVATSGIMFSYTPSKSSTLHLPCLAAAGLPLGTVLMALIAVTIACTFNYIIVYWCWGYSHWFCRHVVLNCGDGSSLRHV